MAAKPTPRPGGSFLRQVTALVLALAALVTAVAELVRALG